MSFSSDYSVIKQLLEDNGYKEIPDLLDAEDVKTSHEGNGFVLQPIGSEEIFLSSNCLLSNPNYRLQLVYLNMDVTQRNMNYLRFNGIKFLLAKLNGFKNFSSNPTFGRLANFTNNTIGTLEFYYGESANNNQTIVNYLWNNEGFLNIFNSNLPTSDTGLEVGELWNNEGFVCIKE